MNIKRVILNILDYLRYQVENDKCTSDELKSILEIVSESMEISATIKDMADFYGQSESNVSNVISRRPIPKSQKPKRRVYYNLAFFSKIIPKSWIDKKEQ